MMTSLLMPVACCLTLMTPERRPSSPPAIPPRVHELIHYLRSVAPAKMGGLVPRRQIEPDAFLRFVSSEGVVFSDVNTSTSERISRDKLRQELRTRRGLHYRYIVHCARSIAEAPDSSRPELERQGNKVKASVLNYNLIFVAETSGLALDALEYVHVEGD